VAVGPIRILEPKHPCFGTEERAPLASSSQRAARLFIKRLFIRCREPDLGAVRYIGGAEQGTKASPCRGAIAAVREA
jgi:hypothetical protein